MLTGSQLQTIMAAFAAIDTNANLAPYGRERLVEALLSEIASNPGGGGSGGGGGLAQSDIESAINGATDINTVITRLTEVRDNLANNRYEYVAVMDDNDILWIRRMDRQSAVVDYFDESGLPGTPAFPTKLGATPLSDTEIDTDYFEAISNGTGGNWAIGDILERVRLFNNGNLVNTSWYRADGSSIPIFVNVGTDVVPQDRVVNTLLRAIQALSQDIENNTDTLETLATDTLAAIGPATTNTALPSPGVAGNVNQILRSIWSYLVSRLGARNYIQYGSSPSVAAVALPVNSRLVSAYIQHNAGVTIYLQIHNSSTALVAGAVPQAGFSIGVANNGTFAFTAGDRTWDGANLGPNPVIALSTARNTYQPPTAPQLANITLTGEYI